MGLREGGVQLRGEELLGPSGCWALARGERRGENRWDVPGVFVWPARVNQNKSYPRPLLPNPLSQSVSRIWLLESFVKTNQEKESCAHWNAEPSSRCNPDRQLLLSTLMERCIRHTSHAQGCLSTYPDKSSCAETVISWVEWRTVLY